MIPSRRSAIGSSPHFFPRRPPAHTRTTSTLDGGDARSGVTFSEAVWKADLPWPLPCLEHGAARLLETTEVMILPKPAPLSRPANVGYTRPTKRS